MLEGLSKFLDSFLCLLTVKASVDFVLLGLVSNNYASIVVPHDTLQS